MIACVLAPNPGPMTLSGTNSYVIADDSGAVAVVDPGPDDAAHLDAIERTAQPFGPITTVLVTHRHLDHLPAAEPLCARTGATLVGHADLPGVQRAVGDQDVVFGSLVALTTPGHTRESLSFWDARAGNLLTGDLIIGSGTVIVDDQPGALQQYLTSLERLLRLTPRTIYPGHGPRIDNAPARISEYLAHRQQRLHQVITALAAESPLSVDELVRRNYPDLTQTLVPMAARNVLANLDLLAEQGRAARAGDGRWQLTI